MADIAELSPIQQLEHAVEVVPPDVALARTAVKAVSESLPGADPDEQAELVQRTAELTGQMATALATRRMMRGGKAAVEEFTTHSSTFAALARVMGVQVPRQEQPTRTAGKNQTGGKR